METSSLELFVEVSRLGGFASVARRRNVDPSSVSRIIAALEAELKVRLFNRTTRKLSLTAAGARYLARVEPLIAELAQAREDARLENSRPVGLMRITTSVSFGLKRLNPRLAELRQTFPELVLDLVYTDANLDLVAEGIDLAIRLGPPRDSSFVGVKLLETRYRVCASPGYLAASPNPLDAPEDLVRHPCLRFRFAPFQSRWRVRRAQDPAGEPREIPIDGPLLTSNALTLVDAARAGLGPALLADWLIEDDLGQGTLVDLFPEHEFAATSWDTGAWALYPSRTYLPAKTRAVLDWLKTDFRV